MPGTMSMIPGWYHFDYGQQYRLVFQVTEVVEAIPDSTCVTYGDVDLANSQTQDKANIWFINLHLSRADTIPTCHQHIDHHCVCRWPRPWVAK